MPEKWSINSEQERQTDNEWIPDPINVYDNAIEYQ